MTAFGAVLTRRSIAATARTATSLMESALEKQEEEKGGEKASERRRCEPLESQESTGSRTLSVMQMVGIKNHE